MNVNFLGEAILGEEEAQRRLEKYLAALQSPEIECMSVKISTIYSQISAIARRHTVKVLCDRLELILRAAAREVFVRPDGSKVGKFVYLDMEEYRDLRLTAATFMTTLERPGLEQVRAGIALQAYIPDSHLVQRELSEWAQERVRRGGSPITVRVVKGANMEMERVEASIRGWPQAPYKHKHETDANYKRMLQYGMQPEIYQAVQLGVASHNLFDLAYAIVLAASQGMLAQVQFEMLEGMANHQRRALFELCHNVLLYAPACHQHEFINAIGYLIRRLDENTGPDNFLRHAFNIQVDSPAWKRLESGFKSSLELSQTVSDQPRRTQDRRQTPEQPAEPILWEELQNEPDTDVSLIQNGLWAESIIEQWKHRCDSRATEIALCVAGETQMGEGGLYESPDPSRPGVVAARYHQASPAQIRRAIQCAADDPSGWRQLPPRQRYDILRLVAQEIRVRRGDLMGAALADGGKTLLESDPEVSEAIDFVEFYARCALDLAQREDIEIHPLGVVAVISPWNFPIAIPCGGIAAALAAGNTVLLKPASDTVLPASVLCECFWAAGVPRTALQLIPCSGSVAGNSLVGHPDVKAVILTGGTETAQRMLKQHPHLFLLAETGGKNATIVTGLSDRDQVIKNVLHSAFSHSGQKCSATSLLLLEEEVFDDTNFREQFADAISSMSVGSAWELKNKMGPLIRPPSGALLRGLKELEHGESWAVLPKQLDDNPSLYSPAVKWNVQPDSFTHKTELFGPVLGVMKIKNLSHGIELVHATGYGLTSGLESLDDREQELWSSHLRAGNLYINRPTTGAIVLRQPFGGLGLSAFGPGIKAGGPNYIIPLCHVRPKASTTRSPITSSKATPQIGKLKTLWEHLEKDTQIPAAAAALKPLIRQALVDFDQFASQEILESHDHFKLIGQDNLRRYLPVKQVRIRVELNDRLEDTLIRIIAAIAVGCRVTVSAAPRFERALLDWLDRWTEDLAGTIEFVEESDELLAEAIRLKQTDRVRYVDANAIPLPIRSAALESHIHLADRPVTTVARVEALWYVEEQSLCRDYHRYGNLGVRGQEQRTEPS
jgi:RHH-type proline utilization regulon transcriptional repressor/proline dehydrogenase/delta 1-pyrroline-5-carboxylate dehydrogenase